MGDDPGGGGAGGAGGERPGGRDAGLVAEERTLRQRLAGVQARIDPLVTAIENGAGYGSVKDCLAAAEAEKESVEGELTGVAAEIEQLRQHALSLDLVAATYSDFPTILDALRLQGDQYGVKRLIGMFVEVIEWPQDAADPSKGTVDIQLFEQARPEEQGRRKSTLTHRRLTAVRQGVLIGSASRIRTYNPPVNSRLLYR